MSEVNNSEYDVSSLLEMGIEKEVAIAAMERVEGNLEDAVNYIFSNELPEKYQNKNNNNDYVKLEDNLETKSFQPGDLSNVIEKNQVFTYTEPNISDKDLLDMDSSDKDVENENTDIMHLNQGQTDLVKNEDTHSLSASSYSMSSTGNNIDTQSDIFENPPSYNIIQHPVYKSEINDPTIVLPIPVNSIIENYLALFALAIANFVPEPFLIPDFKNLNYNEAWYKSNTVTEPNYKIKFIDGTTNKTEIVPKQDIITEEDNSIVQPETLWQLQKLISVCIAKFSERAYVSANIFSKTYDSNVQQKLSEVDHLYEILPTFIKSLMTDLQSCPNVDAHQVGKVFVSTALYRPTVHEPLQETLLTLFHFLPEEYDSNLYKMFNVLLYPDDKDNDVDSNEDNRNSNDEDTQPENSLKYISPFITIILNEIDESTEDNLSLPDGIDIPFEFYPQLYSKSSKEQLIKHIIEKRKSAQFELKCILNDINHLKSYQGKDILMFLNSTLDYLQKDSESQNIEKINNIMQQIDSIKTQMTTVKTQKKDLYKDVLQKLHNEWNLSYPELHIIQTAKQLHLIDNPYLLTMFIISPYLYYMRDRTENTKWVEVKCNTLSTDFAISKNLTEAQVKEVIKQYTRVPSETPIMFTYVKEDSMITSQEKFSEILESNEGCQQFHKADQLNLLSNK